MPAALAAALVLGGNTLRIERATRRREMDHAAASLGDAVRAAHAATADQR